MRERAHLVGSNGRIRYGKAVAAGIALLGCCKRGTREAIGKRRLADARVSAEEPAVMYAPVG